MARMKNTPWIPLLLNFWFATEGLAFEALNLNEFCEGQSHKAEATPSLKLAALPEEDMLFVDRGFCSVFRETQKNDTPAGAWKIRFYASHSITRYFNSDISFQSSRYSVEIKDYECESN